MADRPPVVTKKITRDKLAQFLPSHELIKAFEAITQDVSQTLPDAIQAGGTQSDEIDTTASAAFAQAAAALAMAVGEEERAQLLHLSAEVSALRALLSTQADEAAALAAIQDSRIAALQAQMAQLAGQINDLQQGYQL